MKIVNDKVLFFSEKTKEKIKKLMVDFLFLIKRFLIIYQTIEHFKENF